MSENRNLFARLAASGIDWNFDTIRVSLHNSRSGNADVTWTRAEGMTPSFVIFDEGLYDPYELDDTDATPTGVGDPLAGVLRSIDELLEEQ